jgi:hypothetical protein
MDCFDTTTPAPLTTTPKPAETASPVMSSCCTTASFPPDVVRSWIRDRRMLAGVGLVVGGSGLALGWDRLTAVGVAPLIVSAPPCLLMCALGLCLRGRGQQANSGNPEAPSGEPANPTDRGA